MAMNLETEFHDGSPAAIVRKIVDEFGDPNTGDYKDPYVTELQGAEVFHENSERAGHVAEDSAPSVPQKPDIDGKQHMFPPYGLHVQGVSRDRHGFRSRTVTNSED